MVVRMVKHERDPKSTIEIMYDNPMTGLLNNYSWQMKFDKVLLKDSPNVRS